MVTGRLCPFLKHLPPQLRSFLLGSQHFLLGNSCTFPGVYTHAPSRPSQCCLGPIPPSSSLASTSSALAAQCPLPAGLCVHLSSATGGRLCGTVAGVARHTPPFLFNFVPHPGMLRSYLLAVFGDHIACWGVKPRNPGCPPHCVTVLAS